MLLEFHSGDHVLTNLLERFPRNIKSTMPPTEEETSENDTQIFW